MSGDFNAIVSLEEKRGVVPFLDTSSNLLRENLARLKLVDIKTLNGMFTWNNRRLGEEAISERLDRFLVSIFWVSDKWLTSSKILDW